MQRALLGWTLFLVACAGDRPAPDASQPGAFGATCATVSNSSSECTSQVCTDTFDMIGHPVCSQQCTAGMDTTCPAGSMGAKCNMRGYCRP
jgi:hypothetical protein